VRFTPRDDVVVGSFALAAEPVALVVALVGAGREADHFVTARYQKRQIDVMNADGSHKKFLSTGLGYYGPPA
jgi:hypothetical protein